MAGKLWGVRTKSTVFRRESCKHSLKESHCVRIWGGSAFQNALFIPENAADTWSHDEIKMVSGNVDVSS